MARKMRDRGSPCGESWSASRLARLRPRLLDWYAAARRDLPWRESRDPYSVWVSEAMLQQTRVETVVPYFERFLERFPALSDLARAEEEDVLAAWSGLGYYRRARALRAAARSIMDEHGGEFPRTREEMLGLPGVGPYTAGAVLSIAFDLPEPLVDGNVARVLGRHFAIFGRSSSTAFRSATWDLARRLVPRRGGAGDWNQALMELGATLCTQRAPRCGECPWRKTCAALARDLVEDLPQPDAKTEVVPVSLLALVVARRGRLLLERRPAGGRMAGLWQLPTAERPGPRGRFSGLFPPGFATGPGGDEILAEGEVLGHLRHTITRYRIDLQVARGRLVRPALDLPPRTAFFPRNRIAELPLTGMALKILELGLFEETCSRNRSKGR